MESARVVLIHGTWAPNAKWTYPGSALSQALARRLGPEVTIERFQWSSANSKRARSAAASDLADKLTSERQVDGRRVLLIGHSHGGNVALEAAARLGEQGVIGVVCLATPILSAKPRFILPLSWFLLGVGLLVCGLGPIAALTLIISLLSLLSTGLASVIAAIMLAFVAVGTSLEVTGIIGFFVWWFGFIVYVGLCVPVLEWFWRENPFGFYDRQKQRISDHWSGSELFGGKRLFVAYSADEAYWGILSSGIPSLVFALAAAAGVFLTIIFFGFMMAFEWGARIWDAFTLESFNVALLGGVLVPMMIAAIAGLLTVAFGVVFGGAIVFTNALAGLAVGHFSPIDHILLRITVSRFPPKPSSSDHCVKISSDRARSWFGRLVRLTPIAFGLMHSKIYNDPHAIQEIRDWAVDAVA